VNHRTTAKTHCPAGHEYTEENIYRSKDNWRKCRTCHNIGALAYYHRKKAEKLKLRNNILEVNN